MYWDCVCVFAASCTQTTGFIAAVPDTALTASGSFYHAPTDYGPTRSRLDYDADWNDYAGGWAAGNSLEQNQYIQVVNTHPVS